MLRAEMSQAQHCRQWSEGKQIGLLPHSQVPEASGLCFSQANPERAYWINDSGNKARFFYGALGEQLRAVQIKKFKAIDSEALLCTRCQGAPCIIVGDIGDNRRRRKKIKLAFFKDQRQWTDSVSPLRVLELSYPDGAHDAEAMFLSPEGDFYIITKEWELFPPRISAAGVYRLTKKLFNNASSDSQKLERVGELPLAQWLPDEGMFAHVVTDAAINEKRQMLGILSYKNIIEIPLSKLKDLNNSARWQRGIDFFVIQINTLPQQETMAYTFKDQLIWSTEYFPPQAPIFSMTCLTSRP